MKYVIILHGFYLSGAIHDSSDWVPDEEDALKFDSMTEAELFALEHGLTRYAIKPIGYVVPVVPMFDLGGEG